MSSPNVTLVAFDLFGTVVDLRGYATRDELDGYLDHLSAFYRTGTWKPLQLPESWSTVPPFADSRDGLALLKKKGYRVVTCSNARLDLQTELLANAQLQFDAIVPLEDAETYKPDFAAYRWLCDMCGTPPERILFVSGNRTFGDLEASAKLGMTPCLIRDQAGKHTNILALAESLPCLV